MGEVTNMASQKPLTYLAAVAAFAERGTTKQALPMPWRRNTELIAEDGGGVVKFDYMLYGTRIATLWPNGVEVWLPRDTYTTRNRVNDVLKPLGWQVYKYDLEARYYLVNYRTKERREYTPGMKITN